MPSPYADWNKKKKKKSEGKEKWKLQKKKNLRGLKIQDAKAKEAQKLPSKHKTKPDA